jgi:putative membrane protein
MAIDLVLQFVDPWDWGRGVAIRWLGIFFFLAFLALLALGVALLWRRGSAGQGSGDGGDEALQALRLRYARGEMTREEFLQATEDLGGSPPPPPAPPPPPESEAPPPPE